MLGFSPLCTLTLTLLCTRQGSAGVIGETAKQIWVLVSAPLVAMTRGQLLLCTSGTLSVNEPLMDLTQRAVVGLHLLKYLLAQCLPVTNTLQVSDFYYYYAPTLKFMNINTKGLFSPSFVIICSFRPQIWYTSILYAEFYRLKIPS